MVRQTHLNVFLILQQWSIHEVPQQEVVSVHIKCVSCDLGQSLPVTSHHSFVGHHLEQWTCLVEVINCLLQLFKCLPLFKGLWKLSASVKVQELYSWLWSGYIPAALQIRIGNCLSI